MFSRNCDCGVGYSPNMGRYSLVVAYLLWLPPLGWLGLHQCYLGRHYHGVVLFTTFAGFVVGWFRDLWRIPSYVKKANKEDEKEDDGQRGCFCCCSWPVLLLCKCFKCPFGLLQRRREPPKENQGSQPKGCQQANSSGDISDEDAEHEAGDQVINNEGQRGGTNEQVIQTLRQKLEVNITGKAGDLISMSVDQIVKDIIKSPHELEEPQKQVILTSVTQEIVAIVLEGDCWPSLLDNSKVKEAQEKTVEVLQSERVQLCIRESVMQQIMLKQQPVAAPDNQSVELSSDPMLSDDEALDAKNKASVTQARKRQRRANSKRIVSNQTSNTSSQEQVELEPPVVPKQYLKLIYNYERIGAVFLVSRYYRAVVSAAVSDYMETILILQWFLKLLPPLSMVCGMYLVSNIGKPRRLTLYNLLLCSIVAEIVILHILGSLQILVCLVCTILTVFFWKVEPAKQPGGSSRATCLVVTVCAVAAMSLVWGSIIMNVTIEVDGDTVTVSEAFRNFYNSPGWSRMKESIWVTMTMSWEGNWDEAGETLLRMSDLSGTERALSVLGLPRDVDQATIKARYKKLAREWHPDKYQGDDKEAASNKFIEIQQAYTLLTKKLRG